MQQETDWSESVGVIASSAQQSSSFTGLKGSFFINRFVEVLNHTASLEEAIEILEKEGYLTNPANKHLDFIRFTQFPSSSLTKVPGWNKKELVKRKALLIVAEEFELEADKMASALKANYKQPLAKGVSSLEIQILINMPTEMLQEYMEWLAEGEGEALVFLMGHGRLRNLPLEGEGEGSVRIVNKGVETSGSSELYEKTLKSYLNKINKKTAVIIESCGSGSFVS